MHTLTRVIVILLLVTSAVRSSASSLSVSAKHDVLVIVQAEKRQHFRVLFADEELVTTITLNVFVLEQLPSSRAHQAELEALQEDTWLEAVDWHLKTADGRPIALPPPALLSNKVRLRGPAAVSAANRDTAVPMTTYHAVFGFGAISPGDYVLEGSVGGLKARFSFIVRTGSETEFRDDYLRLKAKRTRDYDAFRRLQLERLERNPARLDALYDLIDQALVRGTLAETLSYFERAITAAEGDRTATSDLALKKKIDDGVRQLRAVQRALPEFYQKRGSWVIARDVKDGHYSVRDRVSGAVIRDFAIR